MIEEITITSGSYIEITMLFWHAFRTAARKTVNRVGAKTQPCFTPFPTLNGSEHPSPQQMLAVMPSWKLRNTLMKICGQPQRLSNLHSVSLSTVSKALLKSTNVTIKG